MLPDCDWISYGYPAPVQRLWVGSYIDDILVLLISEADAAGRPVLDLDQGPIAAIRQAHEAVGTKLHAAKRQERLDKEVIWGPSWM